MKTPNADPVAPVPGAQPEQEKVETHTPGPWTTRGLGGMIFSAGDPYGHGQMLVAQVRGWGHLTGRGGGCAFDEDKAIAIQEANARVIAAAPDLLAALKAIDATCPCDNDVTAEFAEAWKLLKAALVRAEGSPV